MYTEKFVIGRPILYLQLLSLQVSKYCNIINVTFRWHFENLAFERMSFMGAQLQINEQNKLKIFSIGYRYC